MRPLVLASASPARLALLREAVTSMSRDTEGQKVLALLRLDGFVAGDPAFFETIAAKVELVRRFG